MISSAIIRTPLLDESGSLSQEWQKFFVAVAGFDPRLTDMETLTAFFSSWSNWASAAPVYLSDTWANIALYPATSYPPLSLIYTTDFTVFYVNTGVSWKFLSGTYSAVLGSIPGTLGGADLNFRFIATDYGHEYLWNGGGWGFAGGDTSGYIVQVPAGTTPVGGLWQICDGSTVAVAQANGTTANVTTPNDAATPIMKAGAAALVANDLLTLGGTGNIGTVGYARYLRR